MATNIVQNSESLASKAAHESRLHAGIGDVSAERIRERAYFIFLARKGQSGDSHADWAQAERELRSEAARRQPAAQASPERAGSRAQEPAVQGGAGVPASAGANGRRSPVLFSGG
ncbi:MAG: DUF2934 domain-containing protein [Phycisphaerales bacterium]